MSQENVDVVMASIQAFNDDDLDVQMATYAPEVVAVNHVTRERFPDVDPVMQGRDAFRRWLAETKAAWRARYQPSEVRDLGDGRVLCRGQIGGVGVSTGIELYRATSVLFTVCGGVIERVEFYDAHDQALRAAGLEE